MTSWWLLQVGICHNPYDNACDSSTHACGAYLWTKPKQGEQSCQWRRLSRQATTVQSCQGPPGQFGHGIVQVQVEYLTCDGHSCRANLSGDEHLSIACRVIGELVDLKSTYCKGFSQVECMHVYTDCTGKQAMLMQLPCCYPHAGEGFTLPGIDQSGFREQPSEYEGARVVSALSIGCPGYLEVPLSFALSPRIWREVKCVPLPAILNCRRAVEQLQLCMPACWSMLDPAEASVERFESYTCVLHA